MFLKCNFSVNKHEKLVYCMDFHFYVFLFVYLNEVEFVLNYSISDHNQCVHLQNVIMIKFISNLN